jgi:predicted nuclease with TOPRIM domain
MKKLEKLDAIESDMKQIKHSLESAHAEITDLKKEQETAKASSTDTKKRIEKLEEENATLRDKIVDIQARSMRDITCYFSTYQKMIRKIQLNSYTNC